MTRRLLALFLLVNVVGIAANLPRIIEALDGAAIGSSLSRWVVGVGTATGDFLDEATADELTPEDVEAIEQELRDGALDDPLDDESVAALVDLWRVLREAGDQLRADELRDLLLEEGVDVTTPAPTASPTGPDGTATPPLTGSDGTPSDDPWAVEGGRSALDALGGPDE